MHSCIMYLYHKGTNNPNCKNAWQSTTAAVGNVLTGQGLFLYLDPILLNLAATLLEIIAGLGHIHNPCSYVSQSYARHLFIRPRLLPIYLDCVNCIELRQYMKKNQLC